LCLHLEIELCRSAGQPTEAQSHIGGNRSPAPESGLERRARNLHAPSGICDRKPKVLVENLPHQLTWMGRRSGDRPINPRLGHVSHSSMILLQIDSQGDPVTPFESQAPWTIDMDRETLRPTPQSMKIKTGLAKRVEGGRRVNGVKPDHNSFLQVSPDPSRSPGLEQFLQTPMPETSDHELCKPPLRGS
jgi:hypothetical protein